MDQPALTVFERIKIQMEYVVPLVRDLQSILGAEVVNRALAERIDRQVAARSGSDAEPDFGRMADGAKLFAAGGALDYEIIASDDEHFDMNIHRCGYAEMMEQLGARDIGHLLICNLDYPAAAGIGMTLERTQTRMQGAEFCDFRYRGRS